MVQPADAPLVNAQSQQQAGVHDVSPHKSPMIKSVIVPQQPALDSPMLPPGVTTEMPYRTRVDYKADDDTSVPTSQVNLQNFSR